MTITKKIGLAFALLFFCGQASASFSDYTEIRNIKMLSGGTVEVWLEGYSNNKRGCNRDVFRLRPSDTAYEQRLSMILAAYMANATVRFSYYGCTGDFIRISSIQTRQ